MERLQTWWVTELYPSKDEDNFGIAGDCEVVKFTDAQAIIAALQSEVKDLKEWLAAYKQSLELAQSSLTQRTAERDTARRRVDELEAREVDVVLLREDLEQRTAELEAAKASQAIDLKNNNAYREQVASLQAELERVRGELQSAEAGYFVAERELQGANNKYDELRTLIAALPKVEGEIVAKAGYLKDKDRVYALFASDEVMNAHLALWQHRQGMEG